MEKKQSVLKTIDKYILWIFIGFFVFLIIITSRGDPLTAGENTVSYGITFVCLYFGYLIGRAVYKSLAKKKK